MVGRHHQQCVRLVRRPAHQIDYPIEFGHLFHGAPGLRQMVRLIDARTLDEQKVAGRLAVQQPNGGQRHVRQRGHGRRQVLSLQIAVVRTVAGPE